MDSLVVFTLADRRLALPLGAVERVIRMVEIIPLPQGPEIVLGVINVGGRVAPVLDIRRRFGLPERPIALGDYLVLASTAARTVALVAESIQGVVACPEDAVIARDEILSGLEYVQGVVKLNDELVLLFDLDLLLTREEETMLRHAEERRGE